MNWKKSFQMNIHAFKKFHSYPTPAIQLTDDPSRPLGQGMMQYGDVNLWLMLSCCRRRRTITSSPFVFLDFNSRFTTTILHIHKINLHIEKKKE
jgi:hypothetical protein